MFERSAVDNVSHRTTKPVLVDLRLTDGQRMSGHLEVSTQRGLVETLNAGGAFLEFTDIDGETHVLAVNTIAAVKRLEVPRAEQLAARLRALDEANPWAILALQPGADRDAIRTAYHRLAKQYHPDRFAGSELPTEIADYVSAVARRLNMAYAALSQQVDEAEAQASAEAAQAEARRKAGPAYQSAPYTPRPPAQSHRTSRTEFGRAPA